MAEKHKSYLQLIREPKMSREALSFETTISTSQLVRYEADPKSIPSDNMNIIINALGDEYIGYLYLMTNDVAKRFIPEGVKKMSLSEAVIEISISARNLYEEIQDMMEIASDGITEDEKIHWIKSKEKIRQFIKAYIALECADGTEV